jgi:hypothetical protein
VRNRQAKPGYDAGSDGARSDHRQECLFYSEAEARI